MIQLTFGRYDFKKRAYFCGLDCLNYFCGRLNDKEKEKLLRSKKLSLEKI
jgi:hypothetical protein